MKKKITWEHIQQEEDTIVSSPAGPLTVNNNVFQYEFWLIHTNFPIKKSMKRKIDSMIGIESLNIISPYRLIISIAKLHTLKIVKEQIEKVLTGKLTEIDILQQELAQFDDWIIYVSPNKEMVYATDIDDDFNEKIKLFEESQEVVGGQIFRPF